MRKRNLSDQFNSNQDEIQKLEDQILQNFQKKLVDMEGGQQKNTNDKQELKDFNEIIFNKQKNDQNLTQQINLEKNVQILNDQEKTEIKQKLNGNLVENFFNEKQIKIRNYSPQQEIKNQGKINENVMNLLQMIEKESQKDDKTEIQQQEKNFEKFMAQQNIQMRSFSPQNEIKNQDKINQNVMNLINQIEKESKQEQDEKDFGQIQSLIQQELNENESKKNQQNLYQKEKNKNEDKNQNNNNKNINLFQGMSLQDKEKFFQIQSKQNLDKTKQAQQRGLSPKTNREIEISEKYSQSIINGIQNLLDKQ
ncbi:hypothetical protein PPERSA_10591 [Pseudocohnilembus persalinus]|uniref:Uncharacterized protein n=1 Tax=Pseudocohnilembus persalinus TaxID=266149 RepID=A0A0V0Q9T3_PSEPJ|nr:hypothetical protein PPERSA_10591 [Pseudocohnilembus persalinus]|eukprot:KRW98820.1 hypothetical protein PPERSA_10591 [Pseudocohnilembus persalinus]